MRNDDLSIERANAVKKTVSVNSSRKGKVIIGLVIFILGVAAGVTGLCLAIKLIFYLGIAVAVIVAVALVWGIITVKHRFDD